VADTVTDLPSSASPARTVVQRGLFFDEIEVGSRYLHQPGRTATETDNVLFSALTMNTQPLHLDAAWSATQPFGERLMNSMWTLATMVGASVTQLTQGTLVAQLGLSDVSFPAPLHHGDTLYTETEILDKRPSTSRPGQGIVTMRHVGRNQRGEVVATATRVALMWRSDAAPRPASSDASRDAEGGAA
jgi:acyl dehydratase